MEHQNNNKLNQALLLLLQPVARLFLRYGRGVKEYFELSKTAFVIVASEDYGVGGRRDERWLSRRLCLSASSTFCRVLSGGPLPQRPG